MKRRISNLNFEIVYVSLNETPLVVSILSQIIRDGYSTRLFMDDRTDIDELRFLEAHDIPYELVHNPLTYVEGLYEIICQQVDAEWVLILTGDEYPTPQFLNLVSRKLQRTSEKVVAYAFIRRWVFKDSDGKYKFSRAKFMGKDRQWRLIRHKKVVFHARIHTPGFDIPNGLTSKRIGFKNGVLHFDWIVHSLDLRKKKLEYYETQMPNATQIFQKWYLPELAVREYRLKSFKDVDLISLSEELDSLQQNKGWIGRTDDK